MFCSMYGVSVVSLVVVAITSNLQMSTRETKVLLLLDRLAVRDRMKKEAAHIISGLAKVSQFQELPESKKISFINSMLKHSSNFKRFRNEYNDLADEDLMEDIYGKFVVIRNEINEIQEIVQLFVELIKQKLPDSK